MNRVKWLLRGNLAALSMAGCMSLSSDALTLGEQLKAKYEQLTTETDTLNDEDSQELDTLLQTIHLKKYNIDPRISKAILMMESGGRMNSTRFEAHHLKYGRDLSRNADEQRMIASSHCWFQLMGWWPYRLNKMLGKKWTWADLYQPKLCVEMAALVIQLCTKESEGKDQYERTRRLFKCYNGSDEYADKAMTALNREIFKSVDLKLPHGGKS